MTYRERERERERKGVGDSGMFRGRYDLRRDLLLLHGPCLGRRPGRRTTPARWIRKQNKKRGHQRKLLLLRSRDMKDNNELG